MNAWGGRTAIGKNVAKKFFFFFEIHFEAHLQAIASSWTAHGFKGSLR